MLFWLFIITILISFAGTFLIIKVARRRNILDFPNPRSSHSIPTPRAGGLAIVFSWYIGILGLKHLNLIDHDLFLALMAGGILAFVGFLDDLFSIKPWIRIIFQVLTVSLGLYFLKGVEFLYLDNGIIVQSVLLSILAVIAGVWFINLYNFLDGIDGYASVEAICIAAGLYLMTQNPVLLILILSVAGFLIWNWPLAKIFMGDTGSTQLGYIFVILAIHFNNNLHFSILGLSILSSLFWFDASLTLWRRWRNKEKLSQAHKKHAYQRIVQYGYSHQKTILISICINAFFILLVFLSENNFISYFIMLPLCLIINYFLNKQVDRRFPFEYTRT